MPHWAHLNEEGMKLYGGIFPDGTVPIKAPIVSHAKLDNKPHRIFKVNLAELSETQMQMLLEILSNKFGAPQDVIRKQIESDGFIPLRESLTSGFGSDEMRMFI